MPDKATGAALLFGKLVAFIFMAALIFGVVYTFVARAFGPVGWGARLFGG